MNPSKTKTELLARIKSHPYWYHNFDLGNGETTNGFVDKAMPKSALPGQNFSFYHMPPSLKGWSVLDIAGWDGALSFEAEKRGAERVVLNNLRNIADGDYAVAGAGSWEVYKKKFSAPPYSHFLEDGFFSQGALLMKQYFNSKLEILEAGVYDLEKVAKNQFDLVMCCGLLYHLRDPFLALQICRKLTKRQVIIESLCMRKPSGWKAKVSEFLGLQPTKPMVEYWPQQGDGSDWWCFSVEALKAMMEDAGFKDVKIVEHIRNRCVLTGNV